MVLAMIRGWLRRALPPAEPDWASITGYVELSRAAGEADWLTPDQFLAGPFRRFLELCGDPDVPARARARMMEFGRASFVQFRDSQVERGANGAELEARTREIAAAWFARPDVADGDYMLEVFDGISNHNYRGTLEP